MLRPAGEKPGVAKLNAVLFHRLGAGNSWFTCLQYRSGARARQTFAKRKPLLRELLKPAFVR